MVAAAEGGGHPKRSRKPQREGMISGGNGIEGEGYLSAATTWREGSSGRYGCGFGGRSEQRRGGAGAGRWGRELVAAPAVGGRGARGGAGQRRRGVRAATVERRRGESRGSHPNRPHALTTTRTKQ